MNREIKLSAMNCHHRFYTLESFFANAKANGYSCVELWTGPQHFYMDYHGYETIAKLKDLEHRYGIKIIGICPEQTNPKPNNMAVRDSGMQLQVEHYFKNAIDAAVEIKANQVVVTSGWAFLDEPREDAYQRSVKMLQKISEYAEQKVKTVLQDTAEYNAYEYVYNDKKISDVEDYNLKKFKAIYKEAYDTSVKSYEKEKKQLLQLAKDNGKKDGEEGEDQNLDFLDAVKDTAFYPAAKEAYEEAYEENKKEGSLLIGMAATAVLILGLYLFIKKLRNRKKA